MTIAFENAGSYKGCDPDLDAAGSDTRQLRQSLERFPPDLDHCDEGILCCGQEGGEERGLATVEPSDAATAQNPPSLHAVGVSSTRRVARARTPAALRFSTDAVASLFEARLADRLVFGRRS